jgi:hypothetical protein
MQQGDGFRIDWNCSCGQEGTVVGKDREDAQRQVKEIDDEHRRQGHREFSTEEPIP